LGILTVISFCTPFQEVFINHAYHLDELMAVDDESLNLVEQRKAELKQILPEIFVDGKIDVNKLREALGDYVETGSERYSFNWAGRIQSLRVRDRRSKATLTPNKKESVDFDNTKNIFIEGENLEVLKILQKSYQGKVKMIYIDPPYNTGNDFVYKDDFSDSLKNYLRYTGQVTGNGEKTSTNTETNGRYHSNWLSMMYPRLFLARNLLNEDGVIFVSIDDNEVHNLRMIMNEIFGEENFVANVVWQKKYAASNDAKGIAVMHDHILVYQRSDAFNRNLLPRTEKQDRAYKNDDGDGKGLWRSDNLLVKSFSENYVFGITNPKNGTEHYPPKGSCWRGSQETITKWIAENRIFFGKDGIGAPQLKRYLNEVQNGIVPTTWWTFQDCGHNDEANKELKALFQEKAPFDTPKPTRLIRRMLEIAIEKDGIVLDFFAGSGTTAHAVLAQNLEDGGNRKFILVQLPELTPEDSEAYKSGYKNIADICKERIRRAIKKIKEDGVQKKLDEQPKDLGFKAFKLTKSNCFVWDGDAINDKETLARHIGESAIGASLASTDALLYELMLREGFKLDSVIEQITEGKNKIYKVTDDEHSLWMCFDDSIDENAVKKLSLDKDDKLIVLDSALTDTQKVNLTRKSRIETV